MFRKLVLVPALALGLTGCLGIPAGQLPLLDSIVEWTKYACQFVPTVSTVADLLRIDWPPLTTAETIANAICAEVTSTGIRTAEGSPGGGAELHGVPIDGFFIR